MANSSSYLGILYLQWRFSSAVFYILHEKASLNIRNDSLKTRSWTALLQSPTISPKILRNPYTSQYLVSQLAPNVVAFSSTDLATTTHFFMGSMLLLSPLKLLVTGDILNGKRGPTAIYRRSKKWCAWCELYGSCDISLTQGFASVNECQQRRNEPS